MSAIATKDLEVGMKIRRGWSTVWVVADKKPAGKTQHGDYWALTLRHGVVELTTNTLDYYRWTLADRCESKCEQTGKHTGS